MYRGVAYDRKDVVAVAVVTLLAAITFTAWRFAESDALKTQRMNAAQVSEYQAECRALLAYDDAAVAAARKRVDAWRDRLLAVEDWQKRVAELATDWLYQPGTSRDLGGFVERRGTFRFLSSSVADWPKIVKVIERLESHPSVAAPSMEIRSSGDKSHRSFDLVRFDVIYLTKD